MVYRTHSRHPRYFGLTLAAAKAKGLDAEEGVGGSWVHNATEAKLTSLAKAHRKDVEMMRNGMSHDGLTSAEERRQRAHRIGLRTRKAFDFPIYL